MKLGIPPEISEIMAITPIIAIVKNCKDQSNQGREFNFCLINGCFAKIGIASKKIFS